MTNTSVGRLADPRQPGNTGIQARELTGLTTPLALRIEVLEGVWLRLGVDTLIEAMPPSMSDDGGLEVTAGGGVVVGAGFAAVEVCWMAGIARMVETGARVVIEDNFVSGPGSQHRWRAALDGVPVGWVGGDELARRIQRYFFP